MKGKPDLSDLPTKGVFRMRGLEMTRLETFTDAAFAFALTLLVISLEPPTSTAELTAALREVPAFLASGMQLMMFWWGHHEWSRRFGLEDGPAFLLSLLLVFTVLTYVVPLRFMFGVLFVWLGRVTGWPLGSGEIDIAGPEDVQAMFAIYGVGFAAMSLSLVLLYLHALRRRETLQLSEREAHEVRAEAGIWGILVAAGTLSTLLALIAPATLLGLPGMAYMLLPVVTPLYAHRMNRRRDLLPS